MQKGRVGKYKVDESLENSQVEDNQRINCGLSSYHQARYTQG